MAATGLKEKDAKIGALCSGDQRGSPLESKKEKKEKKNR